MLPAGAGVARLRRVVDGAVLCARVAERRGLWGRFRGLMLRDALAADEGLCLRTSSIHMLFMRFPIDALFVSSPDASGARRVVAVRHDLRPWRGIVLPVSGAEGVVEVPAGTLRGHGVKRDDVVLLEAAGS